MPEQIRLPILRAKGYGEQAPKAMAESLFAFIPALMDGAFCEGGE